MSKYTNLSDCHVHTHFSTDSEENPENIIKEAVRLGLSHICFTDHNDYDFPEQYGKNLFLLDFDNYYAKMSSLKEKYKNVIDIRIGVEQGLEVCVSDKVNSYDKNHCLDFIIGSSHLIDRLDPYYPEFWEGHSPKEMIERYYQSIIDNIATCENYDVYGHLDYIIRYAPRTYTDYNWKDYYDYIREILSSLICKGKGIEVNTAGIKYGLDNPNPCRDIVRFYRDLGGEIITTGSDAHKAEHLAYSYDIIPDFLISCGFNYYTIFSKRKPEYIKL